MPGKYVIVTYDNNAKTALGGSEIQIKQLK